MRIARLFGAILATLTAGLLLATPAAAQPPDKLTDHITDTTGALTDSGRADVSAAIDRLYRDRHIQLWVVYVDHFSRFKPENWADRTRSASGMVDRDALLAVATKSKSYAFAPPKGLSASDVNSLQRSGIEPAISARNWSGAAVAAADGLNKPGVTPKRDWVPMAIAVAAVVVVLAVLLLLYRRRRRRAAAGQVAIDGGGHSVGQALSTADARIKQISDYVAKHRQRVGAEAKSRFEEGKRQLAQAHEKAASNEQEAIAYANRASTLAAEAQQLANSDVLGAAPKRRGRS